MLYYLASVALLAVAPVLAQDTTSITATPTIPATATSVDAVNSIFATASTAPDVGNPGSIPDYPLCALTIQFCGSLYNANATYSSQVSEAVASATAFAVAATEGKDPNDLSVFPECARSCILANDYQGCGSYNPLCVCQGIEFNAAIAPCQTQGCNREDFFSTLYLAEKLCESQGGILTNPINFTAAVANRTITNGTNSTVGSSSPHAPFVGEGTQVSGSGAFALGLSGAAVVVAMLML
ncbi:MAG: hypothetical protein Q9226_007031 [Calogaya cf. arnoldii]